MARTCFAVHPVTFNPAARFTGMRYFLFFLLSLFFLPPFPAFSQAVIPYAKLAGKYEFAGGGLLIQFTTKKEKLFLITPGAPLQEMKRINKNEYQSKVIKDGVFRFIEEND